MTEGLSRQQRRALERQRKKQEKQNQNQKLNQNPTQNQYLNLNQKDSLAKDESYNDRMGGWIPKGTILEFKGRTIPGMVYFGIPEKYYCKHHNTYHESAVYIDPRKKVSESESRRFFKGSNTNVYGEMGSVYRANYLDWLANGKSDPDCNIVFPILYFCGLERRYFLDDPDAHEKNEICEEVQRLHDIYGSNEKFGEIAERFLNCVQGFGDEFDSLIPEDEFKLFSFYNDAVDSYFKGVESRTFDARDSLQYAKEAQSRGLLEFNVNDKWFESLFLIRFDKEFPNGHHLQRPTTPFEFEYFAASGEFQKTVPVLFNGKPVYQFEDMAYFMDKIFNFCANLQFELGHYFSYIRQNPNSENSFNALKLLPFELWAEFGKHGLKFEEHFSHLASWARQHVEQGLKTTASEISLNSDGGFWRWKLHGKEWSSLREPLALCGFGAAPDYCLRFRNEKPDDPVFIYELDSEEHRIAPESEAYQSALTQISVGAYVLQTEKRSVKESVRILLEMISQKPELTENERRGLKANLKCILELPHDRGYLKRLGNGIKKDWIGGVTRFLVDLAHFDGIVQRQTVSAIEKVYGKLGLDPSRAYSDLHAGRDKSDSKRNAGSKVSELDESRIESIRTDTEKVSEVLGGIFMDEFNAKEVPVEDGQIVFKGLDIKHTAFLQKLLDRDYWTLSEFEELAREHGLLPVGAVETINEWMFEKYEEPLLEGDEGYHIATEMVGTLRNVLEKTDQHETHKN